MDSCNDLPIACNLIEASLAKRRNEIAKEIFSECQQINELANGYEFRFAGDDIWFDKLTEFVAFERKCCPFFIFGLTFEQNQSAIVLTMQGAEGTKEFIREELNVVRSAECEVRN
jgi:hypothetical protein